MTEANEMKKLPEGGYILEPLGRKSSKTTDIYIRVRNNDFNLIKSPLDLTSMRMDAGKMDMRT